MVVPYHTNTLPLWPHQILCSGHAVVVHSGNGGARIACGVLALTSDKVFLFFVFGGGLLFFVGFSAPEDSVPIFRKACLPSVSAWYCPYP